MGLKKANAVAVQDVTEPFALNMSMMVGVAVLLLRLVLIAWTHFINAIRAAGLTKNNPQRGATTPL